MFVVNDLERLKEYGFEKTGAQNVNGWDVYVKTITGNRAFELVASLLLIANPYRGTHENELVLLLDCCFDTNAREYEEFPALWSFEEIGRLVHDGVVDWVESTPS